MAGTSEDQAFNDRFLKLEEKFWTAPYGQARAAKWPIIEAITNADRSHYR